LSADEVKIYYPEGLNFVYVRSLVASSKLLVALVPILYTIILKGEVF
jgi:hypothetical protein